MNALYCINCHCRTPRNFADEDMFNGVYCLQCATEFGYLPRVPKPPTSGSNVQKPIDKTTVWMLNLENLKTGAYGAQNAPETMLRYWKAQEAAGFPGASENVQYFKATIEKEAKP